MLDGKCLFVMELWELIEQLMQLGNQCVKVDDVLFIEFVVQ